MLDHNMHVAEKRLKTIICIDCNYFSYAFQENEFDNLYGISEPGTSEKQVLKKKSGTR